MDWNALLMALIIFPVIWGFSAAFHTRAYLLLGLSVLFLMTSLGGCVVFMRNWKIVMADPPVAVLGRTLFVLGYMLSVVVSIIAIVRERKQRRDVMQRNKNGTAEPTSPGDVATRAAPEK